jgi:pyruvate,water dikinase
VSLGDLEERAKAFCIALIDGQIGFYRPSERTLTSALEHPEPGDVLRGTPASAGTATGPVRIIRTPDDAPSLRTGEVLVTSMNRPDMGAALDRAFVTDEGGLLCHAAIISREMKKPCVIGIADATLKLRTGDRVEVDGTLGVIKVLSLGEDA